MKKYIKPVTAIIIAAAVLILGYSSCSAGTKYNAFLMGDSIIDNYPHSANGLEYYLNKDKSFEVICDYSYEGSKVCTAMQKQTSKLIKTLKKYKGKKNVVILSFGTNDYFKKCGCQTNKLFLKYLKEIQKADTKAKIVTIIPTHIYRVRNDSKIKNIYKYQETNKWIKKYTIPLKTKDFLTRSDIKTDCLHLTSSGYKKTVKQIKKTLS